MPDNATLVMNLQVPGVLAFSGLPERLRDLGWDPRGEWLPSVGHHGAPGTIPPGPATGPAGSSPGLGPRAPLGFGDGPPGLGIGPLGGPACMMALTRSSTFCRSGMSESSMTTSMRAGAMIGILPDRKSTRLNSSHSQI